MAVRPIYIRSSARYKSYAGKLDRLFYDADDTKCAVRYYKDLQKHCLDTYTVMMITADDCVHIFKNGIFVENLTCDEALKKICWADGRPFGIFE